MSCPARRRRPRNGGRGASNKTGSASRRSDRQPAGTPLATSKQILPVRFSQVEVAGGRVTWAVRHHGMRVVVVGHGLARFRREQRENRAAPKRELSALHGRDRACRALLGITGGRSGILPGLFGANRLAALMHVLSSSPHPKSMVESTQSGHGDDRVRRCNVHHREAARLQDNAARLAGRHCGGCDFWCASSTARPFFALTDCPPLANI